MFPVSPRSRGMAIKGAATALDMQKQLYYIQELTQKLQDWERRYWPKILVPRFLEIFGDYVWGLGDRHLRALHRVTELLARLCRLSFDSYVSFFLFSGVRTADCSFDSAFQPQLGPKKSKHTQTHTYQAKARRLAPKNVGPHQSITM